MQIGQCAKIQKWYWSFAWEPQNGLQLFQVRQSIIKKINKSRNKVEIAIWD